MSKIDDYKGILSKTAQKKLIKYKNLMEAAYELFTTKGVKNTAITDIVKKAGVAKGTFYLYFNDKYDLMDKIIFKKSSMLLKEAMEFSYKKEHKDFSEQIICVVDYIIEKLRKDTKLLRLMYKDLSAGLYMKVLGDTGKYNEVKDVLNIFTAKLMKQGYTRAEAEKLYFIIIELVGSVTYTSIIKQRPYNIDQIKPTLFNTIRKLLKN